MINVKLAQYHEMNLVCRSFSKVRIWEGLKRCRPCWSDQQGMHIPRRDTRTIISHHGLLQLAWWIVVCAEIAAQARASLYSFEMTHRYSEKARKELQERHGDAFLDWPQQGTPAFHNMLFFLDLHRHHRHLAPASRALPLMASSIGNMTYYNPHDGLQYTYIELGTPSQAYFVALDTGSDLLWLPCAHCVSCAPSFSPTYNATFNTYDPLGSKTYESVACDSPYCALAKQCAVGATRCPYRLQYLSPASTEGYLVEDVMYLVPQKGGSKIAADIVFGCGTNQTGPFLTGFTVPNGLLGLGMQNISTPSILARAKVMADSFSMCIDHGLGTGRLVFGDRGSSKAHSTPIVTRIYPSNYWVSLRYVVVGGAHVLTPVMALFDTGTTYTYLSSTSYSLVADAVDRAVHYRRVISPIEAFELCYALPNADILELPTITLSFSGGAKLEVLRPYVLINDSEDNMVAVCLTILDSKSTYSIIGHNSMVNHSITFDRVKNKISWIQVPSCYKYQTSDADKDKAAWMLIATIILLSSCFITTRNHYRYN